MITIIILSISAAIYFSIKDYQDRERARIKHNAYLKALGTDTLRSLPLSIRRSEKLRERDNTLKK